MVQNSRKTKHDRFWKLGQQAARRCSKNLAREIKETKTGIDAKFITHSLKCLPNFLGCLAENQFSNLVITQFPCFIIANIDSYYSKGSHWLAIGIFKDSIEIFDPLGFTIFNWHRIPCELLGFLQRMAITRKVKLSPRIQPNESPLCGFYCIFYLVLRTFVSLRKIYSYFNLLNSKLHRNDHLLFQFYK